MLLVFFFHLMSIVSSRNYWRYDRNIPVPGARGIDFSPDGKHFVIGALDTMKVYSS